MCIRKWFLQACANPGCLVLIFLTSLLYGCAGYTPPGKASHPNLTNLLPYVSPPGKSHMQVANWEEIEGWREDSLIGTQPVLKETCTRLGRQLNWERVCAAVDQLDDLDSVALHQFFETYFTPFQIINADGTKTGLITGYYEPLLRGSRVRTKKYQTALYKWPVGHKVGSLPARAELNRCGVLRGSELVYVEDPIEAFFLQVQGSGQIKMEDGTVMRVGYGGTNDHPYKSIGRWLIESGELSPAQATMEGIKAWAMANPSRLHALLDVNPRFVFFREMPSRGLSGIEGPVGALGVPLTAERSIAVDPASVPLGNPVFLSTKRQPYDAQAKVLINRLMFAQDTGSAIKGGVRADYFWGLGAEAGHLAGRMRQKGKMWVLLPKT